MTLDGSLGTLKSCHQNDMKKRVINYCVNK